MPRQLAQSDVLTIHRRFSVGQTLMQISHETGVARNTITAHLQGQHRYPPDVARRVRSILGQTSRTMAPRRIAPPGWITLWEAADMMPHRPHYARAYKYVRAGMLKAKVLNRITCTKPAWVQSFLRKHCPLPEHGLGVFKSEAWILLESPPPADFWKYLRCRSTFPLDKRPLAMAWEVRDAADRCRVPFADSRPDIVALSAGCDQQFRLLLARSLPA